MENTGHAVRKVCIFGGSFNPPHMGHVRAAEKFSSLAKPDVFTVIPSFVPPHKIPDEVGAHYRLEMARLAFSHVGYNTEISDCEIKRGGKSYTFITVTEIEEKYPGCEICLFVGSDMLLSFDSWYRAGDLFKKCRLYVMPRHDDKAELMEKAEKYRKDYGADITFIEGEFYEISSTELREAVRCKNAEYLEKHLPKEVYLYIKRENLYRKEQ